MELASHHFPPESITCRPGNILLCRLEGKITLFRVDDLVSIKRLVPLGTSNDLAMEEHLLDSAAPAYSGEVYLLLTLLTPSFGSVEEARDALRLKKVVEETTGLLRNARDFPKSLCQALTD